MTIDLLAVANRFLEGHRIRRDISSSNFRFFALDPSTGERLGFATHKVRPRNTVYHDPAHPSFFDLPLLSASARERP